VLHGGGCGPGGGQGQVTLFFRISHMPILEMRAAQQTSTKESDEWVTELPSGIERFRCGRVAPEACDPTLADSDGVEAFDRLFDAALRVPILILRGAQECQIKKQAYGFHLGGRCAR